MIDSKDSKYFDSSIIYAEDPESCGETRFIDSTESDEKLTELIELFNIMFGDLMDQEVQEVDDSDADSEVDCSSLVFGDDLPKSE